jgi:hypothetical protein
MRNQPAPRGFQFCCAALVLPDGTWADTVPQDAAIHYALFSRRTDVKVINSRALLWR